MYSQHGYRGRFAPSPTGPLHFGSLVAATASYLDARAHHGKWLVRMEDIDKPREVPGAADEILKILDIYGFEWDETVLFQSQRLDLYHDVLNELIKQQSVFPCSCSRKEIAETAQSGIEGLIYPGTCRKGPQNQNKAIAWRLKVEDKEILFQDRLYGEVKHHLVKDIGDFVLKRADGIFAYQLAVVFDDEDQSINQVVRGADLLNSTTKQLYLQQKMQYHAPEYMHIPLVTNHDGQKLSKQTQASPIPVNNRQAILKQALLFLGLDVPKELYHLNEIWAWAIINWKPQNIGLHNKVL